MFCRYCGKEITEGKKFCSECGKSVEETTPQTEKVQANNQGESQTNVDNSSNGNDTKVYKILSYIGILWLVGMFCSKKGDKSVRFHVGQGIMTTIVAGVLYIVVAIINNLVIANIFADSYWGIKVVSGTGFAIMGFLDFAVAAISITLEIIGIVNAAKGNDKELPVIGSHAFYK